MGEFHALRKGMFLYDALLKKPYFHHVRLSFLDYATLDALNVTLGGARIGDLELDLGVGFSFVREAFDGGTDNSEGTLLLTLDVDRSLGRNLSFSERLVAYPDIQGDGNFRLTSQTIFKNKIAKDLSLVLDFLVKHDSNPPAGIEDTDFTVSTGIRRDF